MIYKTSGTMKVSVNALFFFQLFGEIANDRLFGHNLTYFEDEMQATWNFLTLKTRAKTITKTEEIHRQHLPVTPQSPERLIYHAALPTCLFHHTNGFITRFRKCVSARAVT